MQTPAQIVTTVAELMATALIGILLDRWLGTKAAVVGLCICLALVVWLNWKEVEPIYQQFQKWTLENRWEFVAACAFVGMILFGTIGFLASQSKPIPSGTTIEPVVHEAKPTITMTSYGSLPNSKMFAIVKVESPPPIDAPFHLLLICRVLDSAVDEMEDVRIEKSSLRPVTGQTIEMTVSQDFLRRAYELKFVHIILALLPDGVEPNKISKLSDVPLLGGQIAIISGFVPTIYPDAGSTGVAGNAPTEAELQKAKEAGRKAGEVAASAPAAAQPKPQKAPPPVDDTILFDRVRDVADEFDRVWTTEESANRDASRKFESAHHAGMSAEEVAAITGELTQAKSRNRTQYINALSGLGGEARFVLEEMKKQIPSEQIGESEFRKWDDWIHDITRGDVYGYDPREAAAYLRKLADKLHHS